MSEDVSTSELSTCETLATRTDVMPPLKAQASCMSWSKICTWRISPLWVPWSLDLLPHHHGRKCPMCHDMCFQEPGIVFSSTVAQEDVPHTNVSCGQSTGWKHVQESPIIFGEVSLSLARWMAKWCSLTICHNYCLISEWNWWSILKPVFLISIF